MKSYTGKTVDEALAAASEDSGTPVEELIYVLTDKTKGIFAKKVVVEVYDLSDVIKYAEDYVLSVIDNLGIESTVNTKLDDDIIRIIVDSTHNPILIGKNGKTLLALNELTKLAVCNRGRREQVLFESTVRNGKMFGYSRNYIKVERDYDPALVGEIVDVIL